MGRRNRKKAKGATDVDIDLVQPSNEEALHLPPVPRRLAKYYAQRHRLFHRFHLGIVLDEESWYSVTPEKIAAHHAHRLTSPFKEPGSQPGSDAVIVDAFCGSGGNTIQFAAAGARVIAIDIVPARVANARINANIYGVCNYIDFVVGDVHEVLSGLSDRHVDAVFLSPPWGGPDYSKDAEFDVSRFVPLVEMARNLCPNVAIMVPRNTTERAVQDSFGACEMEMNYLGGKLKTITLYFGALITSPLDTQ